MGTRRDDDDCERFSERVTEKRCRLLERIGLPCTVQITELDGGPFVLEVKPDIDFIRLCPYAEELRYINDGLP